MRPQRMVDKDILEMLIKDRASFRIGSRGICIDIRPMFYKSRRWNISIPRASVSLDVDDISILDDADFFHLTISMDDGLSYESLADLTQYDKLTVI